MSDEKTLSTEIAEILSANKEQIKSKALESLKLAIMDNIGWSTKNAIQKAVDEFMEAEIIPEIGEVLKGHKQEILDGIIKSSSQIAVRIAELIAEKAMKNLSSDSYRSGEIIKKIFD